MCQRDPEVDRTDEKRGSGLQQKWDSSYASVEKAVGHSWPVCTAPAQRVESGIAPIVQHKGYTP
jgi:hypothetical protein